MIDLDKLAPMPRHGSPLGRMTFFYKDAVKLRTDTAKAVAQRCYELCKLNTGLDSEFCAQDIAAEFGLDERAINADSWKQR